MTALSVRARHGVPPTDSFPVDCEIDLSADCAGDAIAIRGSGSQIVVQLRDVKELRAIARALGGCRTARRYVRTLARLCRGLDLQLTVRVGARPVARLGSRLRPNWLGRLLALGDTRLSLAALGATGRASSR